MTTIVVDVKGQTLTVGSRVRMLNDDVLGTITRVSDVDVDGLAVAAQFDDGFADRFVASYGPEDRWQVDDLEAV